MTNEAQGYDDFIIEVDFNGARALQRMARFDRIAEGGYLFKIVDAKREVTRNQKPMIVVTFEVEATGTGGQAEYVGKRVGENYVMPVEDKDSRFGRDRFAGLLKTITNQMPGGAGRFDLRGIIGKQIVGIVTDDYNRDADRYSSTINEYIAISSTDAAEALARPLGPKPVPHTPKSQAASPNGVATPVGAAAALFGSAPEAAAPAPTAAVTGPAVTAPAAPAVMAPTPEVAPPAAPVPTIPVDMAPPPEAPAPEAPPAPAPVAPPVEQAPPPQPPAAGGGDVNAIFGLS